MKLSRRKAAACLVTCLVVVFVGPRMILNIWFFSQVSPNLEPLPAPEESPGDTVAPIEVGNLILNASVSFTGGTPHQGPESFGFTLMVNASNNGEYDISDFQVVKATAFRLDLTPVFTFAMTTSENMTIVSGTNVEFVAFKADKLSV